ncbi:MAG: DUF262 domain-containing protein [Halioglobus sp.]
MKNMPKFRIRREGSKPLSWWKNRKDEIDMIPSYQRKGRLWSTADKGYLIDSILNGFDIPKLYVADYTWGESTLNESKLPYAIIDGKQRFEAIFDFFEGKLVLNSDFKYRGNSSLKLGGLGYKDLQKTYSDIAEEFDIYPLDVMSVFSESEDLINDLFVRLNRSKPLTGAELRNAMGGPVPSIVREITGQEFFVQSIRFSCTRGQDQNAAAKLLLFEYYDRPEETKKTNLDKFARDSATFDEGQRAKLKLSARAVFDTLGDMQRIFLPKDQLLTSAGIFPVYYWLVRDLDEEDQVLLRGFLVEFEAARIQNRKLLKEDPQNTRADNELVEYDNYNRSTNDQISHVRRHSILRKRFEQYSSDLVGR